MVAATMSLPERAGQGRNYDYRYAWIRDQCYTGQAVAVAGPHPLLDDAVRFVTERLLADGPDLKPAYTVAGGAVPGERSLQLPGYPGVPTSSATTPIISFNWTFLGRRCCCSPPLRATTVSTVRATGRSPPRSQRSPSAGSNPMPESGSWTIGAGRIPG